MNNQTLVIYDFKVLYEILSEIENYTNFNIVNIKKISDLTLSKYGDYLIISNKKKEIEDLIVIDQFPIDINKLIESINIKFLKKKYNQQ